LTRARTRTRPVRAHTADVGGERERGKSRLIVLSVSLVEEERACSDESLRVRGVPVECAARGMTGVRGRPLRVTLRTHAGFLIEEVLHVSAGRIADDRPGVELNDPQVGPLLAQDPRVGRTGRAGADDDDIDG